MAVTLTESAAARVQEYLAKRGGIGLRLGVKTTGCSGYSYVIDYAQDVGEDDASFESQGVKVVIDKASLPLIEGTQVDFINQGLNQMFSFNNPNAGDLCGCGESFNPVD